MSLNSTEQHGNPHGDTVTELLQIAARSYLADPWNDSKERALASVIRSARRAGWTDERMAQVTGMSGVELRGALWRWAGDAA